MAHQHHEPEAKVNPSDAPSDRDLFHLALNADRYPEAFPTLRSFILHQLNGVHQRLRNQTQENSLSQMYTGTFSAKVLSECLYTNYCKVLRDMDGYRARRRAKLSEAPGDMSHAAENIPTLEFAKLFLMQSAPAKLVDGSWLQYIATSDSYADVRANLFDIFVEELGEGVFQQNHVVAFRKLLGQIGINMPCTNSRDFVDQTCLFDSAFRVPLIQLALSRFPDELLPEILGFNLGYEQLPLHLLITVEELKALGVDPYYFQLHVTIDNSATGHAKLALDAVVTYLDHVSSQHDPETLSTHWRRILAGYALNDEQPCKKDLDAVRGAFRDNPALTAYDGTRILQLAKKNEESSTHLDSAKIRKTRVLTLLRKYAPYAAGIHPVGTLLGGSSLRAMLAPSDEIITKHGDAAFEPCLCALQKSEWVVPGRPEDSLFFTALCEFGGPMFGVFAKEDQKIIVDWIAGLDDERKDLEPESSGAVSRLLGERVELDVAESVAANRLLSETSGQELLRMFKERATEPVTRAVSRYFIKRVLAKSQSINLGVVKQFTSDMGMTLELLSYDFVFLDEVFAPDLHPTKTGTALTEIWMLAKGYGEHSGGTAACWRSIPTRNKLSAHSSETTARIQAILVGISQHPHSFMPEILGICLFWSRLVWGCVVPAVLNVLVRMDLVSAREELKLHGARETVLRVANKLESAITEELPGWQTARLAAGYSILASALGVQPNL